MPFDFNQLVLLGFAVVQLGAAYVAYLAHKSATEAKDESIKNGANILVIEKATNSMKDALVAATAKASFAAGKEAEQKKPSG